MSDHHDQVSQLAPDVFAEKLPRIFRIQSIERLPSAGHNVRNTAVLFHEGASIRVEWETQHPDTRLVVGSLASIRWSGSPKSVEGSIRIARLVPVERPEVGLNLFETIPARWLKDRDLAKRAARLWEYLPSNYRQLFNAVFWEGRRFQRFVIGPSSMKGHHAERNGNLRHSIEVAERALALATSDGAASVPMVVLAGLLHDAGKADEYRFRHRKFELSDRGRLIGHRLTVVEWIAVARVTYCVEIPETDYLALIHALTSTKGAPAWSGMREPQSLDATILSAADRLSATGELIRKCAPTETGFGGFHPHLGVRPFVLR
jgi:3'-5' exoribonuclease